MLRLVFATALMLVIGFQVQAEVKWNNSSSGDDTGATGKINTYGGSGYINETENPNFAIIHNIFFH